MAKPPKPGTSCTTNEYRRFPEISQRQSPTDNGEFHERIEGEYLNHGVAPDTNSKMPVHFTYSCDSLKQSTTSNVLSQEKQNHSNLKAVRRSNKVIQAFSLPTVININPRSLNKKIESFKTYIEEE